MDVVGYGMLTVVFPGNMTVKHRRGLRAGLGVQLVVVDDRAQAGSRIHDRGGKLQRRD